MAERSIGESKGSRSAPSLREGNGPGFNSCVCANQSGVLNRPPLRAAPRLAKDQRRLVSLLSETAKCALFAGGRAAKPAGNCRAPSRPSLSGIRVLHSRATRPIHLQCIIQLNSYIPRASKMNGPHVLSRMTGQLDKTDFPSFWLFRNDISLFETAPRATFAAIIPEIGSPRHTTSCTQRFLFQPRSHFIST